MQSIVKPKAYVVLFAVWTILWIACLALNRWDMFGDTATTPAAVIAAVTTAGLALVAVGILVSPRFRAAVLREGVDFASVRHRFVLTAVIALIIGVVQWLTLIRRVS